MNFYYTFILLDLSKLTKYVFILSNLVKLIKLLNEFHNWLFNNVFWTVKWILRWVSWLTISQYVLNYQMNFTIDCLLKSQWVLHYYIYIKKNRLNLKKFFLPSKYT